MSRCRQTDELLNAIFAGVDLTRTQAVHAAGCSECAHALSQARRFEGELGRVGVELSPEPMPAAAELTGVATPRRRGGWIMTSRRSFRGGAVAAVLLVGVIFGGGQWLGSIFEGQFQPGITPASLQTWLDRAVVGVVEDTGRGTAASDWEPIQVEVCGATAIAFYVERDPTSVRAFRWAVGEPGRLNVVAAGGIAGTLAEGEVAKLRAELPVCEFVVDPALDEVDSRGALVAARTHLEGAYGTESPPEPAMIPAERDLAVMRVLDTSLARRDLHLVLLGQPQDGMGRVERVSLSMEDDGSFRPAGSRQDPFAHAPLVVYHDPGSMPMYFAVTGDVGVAAVELIGLEGRLRYTVQDPGFFLEVDAPVDSLRTYRLLDANGTPLVVGEIEEAGGLHAWVLATTCEEFFDLSPDDQLATAEAFARGPRVESMRIGQQLPEDATTEEIVRGVASSIDKVCQGSPPEHEIMHIIELLYD